MSKWIKKGDQVLVVTGNDKGKTGSVLSRTGDRVIVRSVNVRKKHVKSKDRAASQGIVEMERSIHISNVALCNTEGARIHVKPRTSTDGKGKELFYVDAGKQVVHRLLTKESTH